MNLVKDTRQGGAKFLQEAKFNAAQLLVFFDLIAAHASMPTLNTCFSRKAQRQHKLATTVLESLDAKRVVELLSLPHQLVSPLCYNQYQFFHLAMQSMILPMKLIG
jgi:hypothetical protein